MPVFDFSNATTEKKDPECTYTTFHSNETKPSPEKPILVLDNTSRQWNHHSCGIFLNPTKRTAFEFKEEDETIQADILKIDARFISLLRWLGENHITVRLSGANLERGYAVYKIREIAFGGGTKLSAEDGFLQFIPGECSNHRSPSLDTSWKWYRYTSSRSGAASKPPGHSSATIRRSTSPSRRCTLPTRALACHWGTSPGCTGSVKTLPCIPSTSS